jgi:cyclopropane-fatty-acyl-phospholipid synthase
VLLQAFFAPLVRSGRLTIVDARGRRLTFGDGGKPAVTIRLHDRWVPWFLFRRPELHIGEAYMEGRLSVEEGSLYDFLDLMTRHGDARRRPKNPLQWFFLRLDRWLKRLHQFNPAERSRRNAAHHYDLSSQLYDLFLDADRQYSCAYYVKPADSLEQAQAQKKRHIAAKLRIEPGMRVLDIGCGWGGLGLYLADRFDARVTGITLAEEQLKVASVRARAAGVAEKAQFVLRDYRDERDVYDRIVSVGMFEHVGVNHFDSFFRTVRDRLADDGVALVHTIGRASPPGATSPFIRKYIFPGGYIPSLSEIVPVIERTGLWLTDLEVLRLHYALTLREWRERFLAARDRARALYDERFCRMWEFYLAGSEVAFRSMRCVVFQLQLTKRQDALPIVRDYMTETEHALALAEGSEGQEPARRDRAA